MLLSPERKDFTQSQPLASDRKGFHYFEHEGYTVVGSWVIISPDKTDA